MRYSPHSVSALRIFVMSIKCVAMGLLSAGLVCSTASAAEAGNVALNVMLTTDKSTYQRADTIILRVLLTNDSERPLFVYAPLDWGESASISIWATDKQSGAQEPETFISDAVSPPPRSKDSFVELLPHHIYGVEFKSKLSELNLRRAGNYELYAVYHSPVPAEFSFGLPIFSREEGNQTSNHVTIAVAN